MTTPTSQRAQTSGENKVAKLFGLTGENWMRHANPWSVWTPVRRPATAGDLDLEPGLDRLVVAGPGGTVPDLHGGQPAAVPPTTLDQNWASKESSASESGPERSQ